MSVHLFVLGLPEQVDGQACFNFALRPSGILCQILPGFFHLLSIRCCLTGHFDYFSVVFFGSPFIISPFPRSAYRAPLVSPEIQPAVVRPFGNCTNSIALILTSGEVAVYRKVSKDRSGFHTSVSLKSRFLFNAHLSMKQ